MANRNSVTITPEEEQELLEFMKVSLLKLMIWFHFGSEYFVIPSGLSTSFVTTDNIRPPVLWFRVETCCEKRFDSVRFRRSGRGSVFFCYLKIGLGLPIRSSVVGLSLFSGLTGSRLWNLRRNQSLITIWYY